jgi:hypothetical protein
VVVTEASVHEKGRKYSVWLQHAEKVYSYHDVHPNPSIMMGGIVSDLHLVLVHSTGDERRWQK